MPTERERLLAVATAKDWDQLMTYLADFHAPIFRGWPALPFARKYKKMVAAFHHILGHFSMYETEDIVTAAIARLTRAGIWED
jgi:hypothetical protein